MSRAISKAVWDQIKVARAGGASYGELAQRTGIPKGTILAHAHRKGWTKDVALARPRENNAPTHNVTDAIAAILHERGCETKMRMSEFLLKAARQLAERDDIVVDSLEGAKILKHLEHRSFPNP
jgi:hypothetical protein